jgi:Lrp/AsnC family leucine-responsive transcriptional regulator
VDDVDRRLLDLLRDNARATYAELGRLAGISAPTAHDRVNKLEAAGVITGYHAAVAPENHGDSMIALVGLLQTDTSDNDRLAQELARVPGVEDCWFVAGDESFVIKVRVDDMASLERMIGTLNRLPGVSRTRTTVVLSTKFEGRGQR